MEGKGIVMDAITAIEICKQAHTEGKIPNLRDANLRDANLQCADLRGADLQGADLRDANLRGAKNVPYIPLACPEKGSFTG